MGQDFSQVRVHSGPASADAAESIGARAYTLGTDIHLGAEARGLSSQTLDRLLAHEAVHTIQQGSRAVAPHPGLTVSSPSDPAEQEAEQIASRSTGSDPITKRSPSLALRDQMRASMFGAGISRSVSPQVQRDIAGKYPTKEGEFAMDLKKTQQGPRVGLLGTIAFTANDKAPDSASIRLLQTVKVLDKATGKDLVWTGAEANRNKAMTKEDKSKGIEGGWFVDHSAAAAKQRTAKNDPAVSPYYRDYWPNPTVSHDGSKKGKTVVAASLADYPSSGANMSFSFETAAKATDTGHIYGTVMWGFAITDAAKGKIEKERAVGRDVTLLSSDKAVEAFDKFYKNPGSSTAPTK